METNKAGLGPLASALYNHIMQYYNNDLRDSDLNGNKQTQQETPSTDNRQDQSVG